MVLVGGEAKRIGILQPGSTKAEQDAIKGFILRRGQRERTKHSASLKLAKLYEGAHPET